jgi:hypothetical protein
MRRSAWIPLLAGIASIIVAVLASTVLPETLDLRKDLDASTSAEQPHMPPSVPAPNGHSLADDEVDGHYGKKFKALVNEAWSGLMTIKTFISGNIIVTSLMIPIVFTVIGKFVQDMLLQFATKRYGWGYDQVSRPPPRLHALDP